MKHYINTCISKTHDVFKMDSPIIIPTRKLLVLSFRSRIGFEHDQHLETFEHRCWRRGGWRGFQRAGDHWYRGAGDAQGIFAVEVEQAVFLPGPGHEQDKRRVGEKKTNMLSCCCENLEAKLQPKIVV